ncbi:hypothetical protein BGX29_001411 [Mortierella sp. GBA35]|nr:hypothetical protein BGX29_001411 [Mortierella sp. GBA35]
MDPRKLKVNELKEQLQLAGLSVNGKKEELVARLLEHQKSEEEAALAAGPPTGSGEAFNWEDPIDDLASPTADITAPAESATAATAAPAKPVTSTTPATKEPTTAPSATTTTTTPAATSTTTTATPAAAASTTVNGVEFQGAVKDVDALKAEIEKRKNRAARFGTALTEQDRAIERAARFGGSVSASVTASLAKAAGTVVTPAPATGAAKATTGTTTAAAATKSSLPAKPTPIGAQIPSDVLRKRQERFGTVAPVAKTTTGTATTTPATAAAGGIKKSGLVLDAAEEEKKRKRAAKFGLPTAEDDASKKAKV